MEFDPVCRKGNAYPSDDIAMDFRVVTGRKASSDGPAALIARRHADFAKDGTECCTACSATYRDLADQGISIVMQQSQFVTISVMSL